VRQISVQSQRGQQVWGFGFGIIFLICCSFSDCVFFCIVLRSFYVLFFCVSIMYLITVLVLPTGVINRWWWSQQARSASPTRTDHQIASQEISQASFKVFGLSFFRPHFRPTRTSYGPRFLSVNHRSSPCVAVTTAFLPCYLHRTRAYIAAGHDGQHGSVVTSESVVRARC